MNIISLFDGISCARVALEKAGHEVDAYFASEIDKHAIQVAQTRHSDQIQIGDVKSVTRKLIESYMVHCDIDLLIGGSPCQDLSIAKKDRKGLSGDRSGLFYEYLRILKEVKPKYFILENVASMHKDARDTISKELGIEPIMIDAALVSAQRRRRLFWVGKLVGDEYVQVKMQLPKDHEIYLKDIVLGEHEIEVDTVLQYRRTYWRKTKGGKVPTLTANMGTGGNNVPYYVVALTEQRTEEAKRIRSEHMKKTGVDYCPRRGKELVPRKDGKANTLTTGVTKESLILIQKGRGFNKGGIHLDKCPTLTSSSWEHNHILSDGSVIRKLHPVECERLQGLPDGYTEGVSNTQRYKTLGNAFNADVVAHIIKSLKIKND